MGLEFHTAEAGGAGIALADGDAPVLPARKDVALVTAFVIGFVVIAFFSAVLVITSSREARYAVSGAPPATASPAAGSGAGGR